MDYNDWLSEIEQLDIWTDLKNKIISLMSLISDNLQVIRITNKKVRDTFINIKSYKQIYIAFDIEFQTMILDDEDNDFEFRIDVNTKGDPIASFPREIGIMVLIRDKHNDVYYLGSTHKNFTQLTEYGFKKDDFKYILSKYTTVSPSTLKMMTINDDIFTLKPQLESIKNGNYKILQNNEIFELLSDETQAKIISMLNDIENTPIETGTEIQHKLTTIANYFQKIPFSVYGKYLTETKEIYHNQSELYYTDPLVKSRTFGKQDQYNFVDRFIDISPDACFIIKGTKDLDAIHNMGKLLEIDKLFDTTHLYDIEIFNGWSRLKYSSAQLEATYNGIIETKLYEENSEDLKLIMTGLTGSAHNPLIDSYYTLVIAIIINLSLNKYFPTNILTAGNINYRLLYQKEKRKYLKIKYDSAI